MKSKQSTTSVPTQWVGPIHFQTMQFLNHQTLALDLKAPIATYETTLFHSVNRGARITRLTKTLKTTVLSDVMTRSLLFEAKDAFQAHQVAQSLQAHKDVYQKEIVEKTSRFAVLERIDTKIVSHLLYIRFSFKTGLASGHNMATFASDAIADAIIKEFPDLSYVSVSGNYCVDKKTSAVNSILGRGKHVVAEMTISRQILKDFLRTTPEDMVNLNIKKNLIGSIAAGSLLSANAHYANMLLAFYIATGQDGANIVEGSQGITYCEVKHDDLYFSVTLPNVIVGTVGHGKHDLDIKEAFKEMDCLGDDGAEKLAQIAAALVLCGELSLLAALTNPKELTNSHKTIERITP
ncbi:MAG: hydroxymethylglutaryl-CoA reductase [Acholeplasmataceae bacterium]